MIQLPSTILPNLPKTSFKISTSVVGDEILKDNQKQKREDYIVLVLESLTSNKESLEGVKERLPCNIALAACKALGCLNMFPALLNKSM